MISDNILSPDEIMSSFSDDFVSSVSDNKLCPKPNRTTKSNLDLLEIKNVLH